MLIPNMGIIFYISENFETFLENNMTIMLFALDSCVEKVPTLRLVVCYPTTE